MGNHSRKSDTWCRPRGCRHCGDWGLGLFFARREFGRRGSGARNGAGWWCDCAPRCGSVTGLCTTQISGTVTIDIWTSRRVLAHLESLRPLVSRQQVEDFLVVDLVRSNARSRRTFDHDIDICRVNSTSAQLFVVPRAAPLPRACTVPCRHYRSGCGYV